MAACHAILAAVDDVDDDNEDDDDDVNVQAGVTPSSLELPRPAPYASCQNYNWEWIANGYREEGGEGNGDKQSRRKWTLLHKL